MGSSRGQDRSLGSGISLPQWMRGKMDSRFDFDQSSFSPPSHDDSFFYIPYPKSLNTAENSGSSSQEGYRPISQVLSENTNAIPAVDKVSTTSSGGNITRIKDVKNIDFSKHPLPCQPFVPAAGKTEIKQAINTSVSKIKVANSRGTDDGFHSEPALCGKSIVHVANRIMSSKLMKIDSAAEATETKIGMENTNDEQFLKKGSQSLPVTPIASPITTPDSSPKSRRRMHSNRYFTGAFIPDRDKYQGGWLLSSILGQSREAMPSNKIQEEDEDTPALDVLPSRFLNRKKSISSQNLSYLGRDEASAIPLSLHQQQHQHHQPTNKPAPVYNNVFQAKPSELREMNFWSPTSM